MIESQRHSYHLVDSSPCSISGSLGVLATTVGGMMHMHSFQGATTLLSFVLIFILYTMFVWWCDVLHESTLEGHHTKVVQLGPRYSFILFIISEVMFFFAFFGLLLILLWHLEWALWQKRKRKEKEIFV